MDRVKRDGLTRIHSSTMIIIKTIQNLVLEQLRINQNLNTFLGRTRIWIQIKNISKSKIYATFMGAWPLANDIGISKSYHVIF